MKEIQTGDIAKNMQECDQNQSGFEIYK